MTYPLRNQAPLSRRAFLQLLGINLAASMIPSPFQISGPASLDWPAFNPADLPPRLRDIFERLPRLVVNPQGRLHLRDSRGIVLGTVPQTRTYWNLERDRLVDRLDSRYSWAIVLHWFGDRPDFEGSLDAYLRGFDSLRPVSDYVTRTSAHFLVGAQAPDVRLDERGIGIVQTQQADKDGTPFLASHLQGLDIQGHLERKNYFVRAFYTLDQSIPGTQSLLQDFFDGPFVDPNRRTLAIELTGGDFEAPGAFPPQQQIANTVSVVYALMKRYRIRAMDILGHFEIQLGKEDPGKKLLSLVRLMVGIQALCDSDPLGKALVFGQFAKEGITAGQAVHNYFQAVRAYLLAISTPKTVFEWEVLSQFNLFMDALSGEATAAGTTDFVLPIAGGLHQDGDLFLVPGNHEGIDYYSEAAPDVQLITGGTCLGTLNLDNPHWKKTALFRHHQADGASFLSIYGNMAHTNGLSAGTFYPSGYSLGTLGAARPNQPSFLHFSIAYGATWETDLQFHPAPHPNAGPVWIRDRYIHPGDFLKAYLDDRTSIKPAQFHKQGSLQHHFE
jgi:hypothetical protein